MKKILIPAFMALVMVLQAGAARADAGSIISKFEDAGITGEKAKYGLSKKVLKILSLRDYGGIVAERYGVGVFEFGKAWGFDRAVDLFQMLTLISRTEVYKQRPYIIVIGGESASERNAVIKKIKKAMPHIREIAEKDR